MPSKDVAGSESFYRTVFGWNIRRRGDESVAFDDAAGEVSGSWVLGRPPMREVGLLVYIMVDSVAATLEEVLWRTGERLCNRSERMPRRLRRGFGILRGMCWGCIRSRRGAAVREWSSSGWQASGMRSRPKGILRMRRELVAAMNSVVIVGAVVFSANGDRGKMTTRRATRRQVTEAKKEPRDAGDDGSRGRRDRISHGC